jgi:type I restriction enzyme M protein
VKKLYAELGGAWFVTKTNSDGTDYVSFTTSMRMESRDTRTPLLPEDGLGPDPVVALSSEELEETNLPDVGARWAERNGTERERARIAQSFV